MAIAGYKYTTHWNRQSIFWTKILFLFDSRREVGMAIPFLDLKKWILKPNDLTKGTLHHVYQPLSLQVLLSSQESHE